tara:strand:+ start:205 stop:612 length:408 start_codon:yes stop_codon:yes gene_type:complete
MTETTKPAQPFRILLAEDDESMRTFISLMLKKQGYDVVDCADGAQAYDALINAPQSHFDLLLSDVVMPVMDGIELTQKALSYDPHLRVLYITGFSGVESIRKPSDVEQDKSQVIPKPFHISELLKKISSTLKKAS